jgi:hypothetical protein
LGGVDFALQPGADHEAVQFRRGRGGTPSVQSIGGWRATWADRF